MPELPEVETVRRGLNQVTLDQPIEGGEVLLARSVAYPPSALELVQQLHNCRIRHWHRRGKYLLAELAPGGWLGVHLRMTGQLLWLHQQQPVQKHARVRLFFQSDQELRFVDQRTFGQIWWVPAGQPPEQIILTLQTLGPEPFAPQFSPAYLQRAMQQRRRSIKAALLDQKLVAGVGNIYADEALFMAHIHPATLCAALTPAQIIDLRSSLVEVLQRAIAEGGTTFSNFLNVQGINGNYGGTAWVYHRQGQACRVCGTTIEQIRLAGRSTHFCPACQPF